MSYFLSTYNFILQIFTLFHKKKELLLLKHWLIGHTLTLFILCRFGPSLFELKFWPCCLLIYLYWFYTTQTAMGVLITQASSYVRIHSLVMWLCITCILFNASTLSIQQGIERSKRISVQWSLWNRISCQLSKNEY